MDESGRFFLLLLTKGSSSKHAKSFWIYLLIDEKTSTKLNEKMGKE